LLNFVAPYAFESRERFAAAQRWVIAEHETALAAREIEMNHKGFLSPYQSVRHALGRLVLTRDKEMISALLAEPDVALRAAAYSFAPLTVEQLEHAHARDSILVLQYAIDNEELWRSAGKRYALESYCWNAPDPHHGMMFPNMFQARRDRFREAHPEWFKPEVDE
jgi:hypothetical protein